jgi:GNAT superfamily N-acetyltransferase
MSDAPQARNETPPLTIAPIAQKIGRRAFVCGEQQIDRWVVDCHRDHERLKSRTWTATLNNGSVASVYSLRIRLESDEDIDGGTDVFRRESNHFAAVQLYYLATHRPFQRHGIGELMILHAIREFGVVADRTGICAMTLVAINADKAAWYERLGFRKYGAACAQPKLFLPAQSAIDLIGRY